MAEKKQKRRFRFGRAERASIEWALNGNGGARSMARDLGRSPASVTDEVRRNRAVANSPGKGGRSKCPGTSARGFWRGLRRATAAGFAATTAPRGTSASTRRCGPRRSPTTDCSPRRAGAWTPRSTASSRLWRRSDPTCPRGLSPAQIAVGCVCEFKVHPTAIYRWIGRDTPACPTPSSGARSATSPLRGLPKPSPPLAAPSAPTGRSGPCPRKRGYGLSRWAP